MNADVAKQLSGFNALALSASCFLFVSGCKGQNSTTTEQTQARASAGRILDLTGKPVNVFQNDQRMPVVLLFVRTDCPISNRYAPEIGRLAREFGNRTKFWLVYADRDETPEQIQQHLREFELDPEAVRDLDHVLVKTAQARVTPEAAVFDEEGALIYHGRIDDRFVKFGEVKPAATTHELQDVLTALAAGMKPAVQATVAVGCAISPNPE